jgi:membrane protein YqaA with SNARE-associated domain
VTPDGPATDSPLELRASEASVEIDQTVDPRLVAYVRVTLFKTAAGLAVLLVILGLLGVVYEEQLLGVTRRVLDVFGLGGLATIVFFSDALFTPIPPDLVLIVLAKSELHRHWTLLIPALGALSTLAGVVAWWLGGKFGRTRWGLRLLGQLSEDNRRLVRRYGRWGVALGAMTPIPYSLTCLTAGALKLDFRQLGSVVWLRIPRFVAYYCAFAYSDSIVRWVF